MKRKFTLLLITLVALSFSTSILGQKKNRKQIYEGYIITLKNDTIEGHIKFVNPAFNELNVIFYKDGEKQKFSPSELSGYAFLIEDYSRVTKELKQDWVYYERRRVKKSPIRQGTTDVFIQCTIFGPIKLYNYFTLKSTKVNKRGYQHSYYIASNSADGGFGMTLITRANYRKEVRKLVKDNEELYKKLGTHGYGYKYFANVIKEQNTFLGGKIDRKDNRQKIDESQIRWADMDDSNNAPSVEFADLEEETSKGEK